MDSEIKLKRLTADAVKAIKTDDVLQASIAAHMGVRNQSVWHLAHYNTSPKLHELAVLIILASHLKKEVKSIIHEDYENKIHA